MARKEIYFLIEGNEALMGYVTDVSKALANLDVKCVIERSAACLISRLKKRKTPVNIIVLLANDAGNGVIARICEEVPQEAQPLKVVFVDSSYSHVEPDRIEQLSDSLQKAGIQPLVTNLMNISRPKVVEQWI